MLHPKIDGKRTRLRGREPVAVETDGIAPGFFEGKGRRNIEKPNLKERTRYAPRKMNNPSPLIPQGSNLEQHSKSRSSLRIKIFCALGVNVAVLLVLLMQGCKREQPAIEPEQIPVFTDTNPPVILETVETNQTQSPTGQTGVVSGQVEPPVDVPPPPVAPVTQEYTIKAGDTYSTIAPKFNVTPKALQAANPNMDPARLQIGKKLIIPAPAPATGGGATTPLVDAASGEVTHTVKSGDTLGALARTYRTTVKAIQDANGLSNTQIKVGQKLKIPKS